MAKATGRGGSLGEAFREALGAAGHPPRPSYTAKSAVAQYKHLMKTEAGRQALDDAGLTAVPQTRKRWLGGGQKPQKPGKKNAAAIHAAYESMRRGSFPAAAKQGKMRITGRVGTGSDVRDRGTGGHAALEIDLSRGTWTRMDRAWWDDDLFGAQDLEAIISEDLIEPDIGGSDWWYFPPGNFTVELDW
jgi:hypothetical protein